MLLQKTGWRIKQFISHRRNRSLEEFDEDLDGKFDRGLLSLRSQTKSTKRALWMLQNSTTDLPSPLGRANNSATKNRRTQPATNSTAHSSASSLCSCECGCNLTSSASLSAALPRKEPRPEILYLPPASSTSSRTAKTWRCIFPEHSLCSSRDGKCDLLKSTVRGSTFNLLEALTMDPVGNDWTPTQSIRNTEDSDLDIIDENVEQLIRETDEAFHAVGEALADARAATQRWHDEPVPKNVARTVSVSRAAFKKEAKPPVMAVKSPITRTKTVAKTKRKGFYKKQKLLGGARNVPPHHANTSARWTLTDMTANMAGIFNGKMFRTEVDEMLTPDRLRRLRQERVENERKISVESARSVDTDGSTPTEPFHLESLSSRLAAADLKEAIAPPFPSPVLPPPTTPRRRRSPGKKCIRAGKVKVTANESGTEFQGLNLPSPSKILIRSNARASLPLPTIHEVLPVNFMSPQPPPDTSKHRKFSFESTHPPPDIILLPSTSFTLTCPTFRQGPIRLEWEKELVPDDEPLDWTAFQMAISGTMDEVGVDERDDIEWAADEEQVDEILQWWDEYKFPGYGRIIHDEPPSSVKTANAVDVYTQIGTPESNSGTGKILVGSSKQAGLVKDVPVEGYAESMPPSPMLAFGPPSPNRRDEIIPMGFNLGHDLGDFLDWEAHYVRKYYVDD